MRRWIERSAFALGGFLLGAGLLYLKSAGPAAPVSGRSSTTETAAGVVGERLQEREGGPMPRTERAVEPVAVKKPGKEYPVLSGTGVSFAARRELGLSDDQCHEVNRIVRAAKSALQAEMLGRMKRDPVFDRPEKRAIAYSIEAFPEVSARIIQQAAEGLENAVGGLGSKIIDEIELNSSFLGSGKSDVLLSVNPEIVKGAFDDAGNPREYWVVSYSLQNPETGGRSAAGVINFPTFKEQFMDLFETPGEERE